MDSPAYATFTLAGQLGPFSPEDANLYREESGDRNPIHYGDEWFEKNKDFSQATGITKPIVPGFLYLENAVRQLDDFLRNTVCVRTVLSSCVATFKRPLYFGEELHCGADMDIRRPEAHVLCELTASIEGGISIFELDAKFNITRDTPGEISCPISYSSKLAAGIVERLGEGVLLYRLEADFPVRASWRELLKNQVSFEFVSSRKIRQNELGCIHEIECRGMLGDKLIALYRVLGFTVYKV